MRGLVTLGALAAVLALSVPAEIAAAATEAPAMVVRGAAAVDLPPPVRPMNDDEKAGAGCVISAVAGMAIVGAIGPTEFIMTVVGGMLVPSSTPVLLVGLVSTVASMTCGLGATLTPVVLWGWRQLGYQDGQVGATATDPVRRGLPRHDHGPGRAVASSGGAMSETRLAAQ
jgi:hypothetical protein